MNSKLYNIEFGTFNANGNMARLSIPKQLFTVGSLGELIASLPNIEDDVFLRIEKVEEDSNNYQFTYQLDTAYLRNMKNIQREHITVRFSIARTILEQDILEHYKGYVSLYPANIWYHPMQTVKYAYRGTYEMASTENESKIIRYKALLLHILFGYPYENALKREYHFNENKNPFAIQIINSENMDQLKSLIISEGDNITFKNIDIMYKREQLNNLFLIATVAIIFLTVVVAYLTSSHNIQTIKAIAADNQSELELALENTQQSNENEIKLLKEQLQENQRAYDSATKQLNIEQALKENDLEISAQLLNEAGAERSLIFDHLYTHGSYELALSYYPEGLEKVIQTLHNNEGGVEQLIQLKLTESAPEEIKRKLDFEKAVVTFNVEKLDVEWVFLEDRFSLVRSAEKYHENDYIGTVGNIKERLVILEYEHEASYIDALLEASNLNTLLNEANKSLEEANKLPKDNSTRDVRITEAQGNIEKYTEESEAANIHLNEVKTALDEIWNSL